MSPNKKTVTRQKKIRTPTARLAPERKLTNPNRISDIQQKDSPRKGVLLRKCPSAGRLKLKQVANHPAERLPAEKRLLPTVRLLVNHAVARARSCRGMVDQAQAMGSGISARVWAPEPGSAGAWRPGLGPRPGDLASPSVSSTPTHDLQN